MSLAAYASPADDAPPLLSPLLLLPLASPQPATPSADWRGGSSPARTSNASDEDGSGGEGRAASRALSPLDFLTAAVFGASWQRAVAESAPQLPPALTPLGERQTAAKTAAAAAAAAAASATTAATAAATVTVSAAATAAQSADGSALTSTLAYGPLPVVALQRKEARSVACGLGFTIVTVATEWMRDEEAPACLRCELPFQRLRRLRHHCRNCGGLFCKACSAQRFSLLRLGHIEPVRVCDGCVLRLAQE